MLKERLSVLVKMAKAVYGICNKRLNKWQPMSETKAAKPNKSRG
jgi:hypothetical protein